MEKIELKSCQIEVYGELLTIPNKEDISTLIKGFPDKENIQEFKELSNLAIDKVIDLLTSEKFRDFRALIEQCCESIDFPCNGVFYDLAIFIYFNSVFGNISNPEFYYDEIGDVLRKIKKSEIYSSHREEELINRFNLFPSKTKADKYNALIVKLQNRFRSFSVACIRLSNFEFKLSIVLAEKPELFDKYIPGLRSTHRLFRNPPLVKGENFSRHCEYCGRIYELKRTNSTKIRVHCEKEECKRKHKKWQKSMERTEKRDPNKWTKVSIGFCPICKTKNVPLNAMSLCRVCVEEAPK